MSKNFWCVMGAIVIGIATAVAGIMIAVIINDSEVQETVKNGMDYAVETFDEKVDEIGGTVEDKVTGWKADENGVELIRTKSYTFDGFSVSFEH